MQLTTDYEFHYVQTPDRMRDAFAEAASDMRFSARVAVVEKGRLARSFVRMRGLELVNYFLAETIASGHQTQVEEATVIMDGARSETVVRRDARVAVSRALGGRKANYFVKRFVVRPAKEESGLQLADMIAGFVFNWQRNKRVAHVRLESKLHYSFYP